MSSQMSTPVNSLPVVDITVAPPSSNDPMVTDVLAEMEQEVAAAQKPTQHAHAPAPAAYMPQQAHTMMPPYPYMKEPSKPWVDPSKLQTAAIASVIAVLLLVPNVSFLYERFERLVQVRSYELFIRAGLLALVLYLAMVKLDI